MFVSVSFEYAYPYYDLNLATTRKLFFLHANRLQLDACYWVALASDSRTLRMMLTKAFMM